MPTDDVPFVARRVADSVTPQRAAQYMAEFTRAMEGIVPDDTLPIRRDALRALLPVLGALAAGADADRVERWARELCRISGFDPDVDRHDPDGTQPEWMFYRDDARAAIALADADRAAEGDGRVRAELDAGARAARERFKL